MTNRLPTLGDRVKCRVTGFTGIVTAHSRYISGCDRLWVDPPVDDNNKQHAGIWIDIDMLEIIDPTVIEPIRYEAKRPGGVDLPNPRK